MNSFPTNYPSNKAVNFKGDRFVVILITNYFKTLKMPVVNSWPWTGKSHCNK